MAKSKFDHSKWEKEHAKHITGYLEEIDALYNAVAVELISIGLNVTPDKDNSFSFSQSKRADKKANKVLSGFRSDLTSLLTSSIAAEWAFANQKNDEWVKSLFPEPRKGYLRKNIGALEGFQRRKMYGHTLSDRIWDYTELFKSNIEWSLDIGIGDGRSAAELSRDVRKYLDEPERLFRRVRDKYGNLTLSKAAEAYHPGQGVYRSSYKNAMRLSRTAVNMAYCEADYNRWQQFDFVVGIKIQVSNSHMAWLARDWYPRFKKGRAPMEICDVMQGVYPKDFKFIGWHPQCKCIATPILSNAPLGEESRATNRVEDVPDNFKGWVAEKKDDIAASQYKGNTPYFLIENNKYVKLARFKASEQMKSIIDSRKEYLSHPLSEWGKDYFNKENGGFLVTNNDRIRHSMLNKQERAKFNKEIDMCRVLAEKGYRIELLREVSRISSPDIAINGMTADLKRTGSHNNILKYAKKATQEQGADMVVFQFDKETSDIYKQLEILKQDNIKGYYFFTGREDKIHKL